MPTMPHVILLSNPNQLIRVTPCLVRWWRRREKKPGDEPRHAGKKLELYVLPVQGNGQSVENCHSTACTDAAMQPSAKRHTGMGNA
mmetsp:Transcript_49073/g.116791  ORF Transcript_49073/g.116791 Transcript_49073/m.116791 type:complete len:86 (+) Transcript_49073:1202-1459(+)